MNTTDIQWQAALDRCWRSSDYQPSPRGMKVQEVINGHYSVPMPAYISLVERNVNYKFMFSEAAWILSGSNRLSEVSRYMSKYANFSDDNQFLKGAYGPKVIDQLPYVVQALAQDQDSRQAVMTIWRERPGPSKDVPCTVAAQFLIRGGQLHAVFTMRSNDVVLGFTYDVFTFSMIANAVRLLLRNQGVEVELGQLHVNAGSLHLYENQVRHANRWIESMESHPSIDKIVDKVMEASAYEELISNLNAAAKAIV